MKNKERRGEAGEARKMKYSKKFVERFRNRAAFTAGDAKRFLVFLGASDAYARVFLKNLVKRGSAARLRRGVYSFRAADSGFADAAAAFFPSYHGLQDALSIHGLWEQETIPVLVTPRRVKQGVRFVAVGKVLVRRIARAMFFGFESVRGSSGEWIRVSDVEKTLIDFVYFKAPLSREAAREIAALVDEKKMRDYLARSPKWVVERVKKIIAV